MDRKLSNVPQDSTVERAKPPKDETVHALLPLEMPVAMTPSVTKLL